MNKTRNSSRQGNGEANVDSQTLRARNYVKACKLRRNKLEDREVIGAKQRIMATINSTKSCITAPQKTGRAKRGRGRTLNARNPPQETAKKGSNLQKARAKSSKTKFTRKLNDKDVRKSDMHCGNGDSSSNCDYTTYNSSGYTDNSRRSTMAQTRRSSEANGNFGLSVLHKCEDSERHRASNSYLFDYSNVHKGIKELSNEDKVGTTDSNCSNSESLITSTDNSLKSLLHGGAYVDSDTSYCSKNSVLGNTIYSKASKNYCSSESTSNKESTAEDSAVRFHAWKAKRLDYGDHLELPDFEETKIRREKNRQKMNNRKLRTYVCDDVDTLQAPEEDSLKFHRDRLQRNITKSNPMKARKTKAVPFKWVSFKDEAKNRKHFRCFKEKDIWPKRNPLLNEIVEAGADDDNATDDEILGRSISKVDSDLAQDLRKHLSGYQMLRSTTMKMCREYSSDSHMQI